MRYFTYEEFASPDMVGSGELMDRNLLIMLDFARHDAGIPFIITSGFRSVAHNAYVGGVENSSHLSGHGVDIRCRNYKDRFLIVSSLIKSGFTRILIYNTYIHVDNDPTKTAGVLLINNK